jgi:hypothetical protein
VDRLPLVSVNLDCWSQLWAAVSTEINKATERLAVNPLLVSNSTDFFLLVFTELWASMYGKLDVYGRWQLRARGELSARCFCIGHGNSKESDWPPIPPIPGTVIFLWKIDYPAALPEGQSC